MSLDTRHRARGKTLGAAEAKSRFAAVLRLVEQGEIVVITRYGKPVAAMVGAEDLGRFERLKAATPEDGLAGLVGRWQAGDEIADEVDRLVASRRPSREPPGSEC